MEILGIIPARAGSKGVPRKNVRLLASRPLIAYTIDAARASQKLSRYVCSTDDPDVTRIADEMRCPLIQRPRELAEDATPMKLVIEHAVSSLELTQGYRPEVAVLLQPTSPLRTGRDIDRAVEMLIDCKADSVVSVSPVPGHFHPDWQFRLNDDNSLSLWDGEALSRIVPRRQGLTSSYTRNGAVYAFRVANLLESGSIYGARCLGYVMSAEDSVNIDSESDFILAERRITELKNTSVAEANH